MFQAQTDDGNLASVLYNRGLIDVGPQPEAPYLHLMGIDMLEPGDDGLAAESEAAWFYLFEDAIVPASEELGFFPLGRVCSHSRWELSFYGSDTASLMDVLDSAGSIAQERQVELSGEDDPHWRYLHWYIRPDRADNVEREMAETVA